MDTSASTNCTGCHKPKPIVNKKYRVCEDCNYLRIHGTTKREVAIQKAKSRVPKLPKSRVVSSKAKATKSKDIQLYALKVFIRAQAIENDKYECCGCHANGNITRLDCSHILSAKQRPDLELVKENIQLLCRDCHNTWESWDPEKMQKLFCFWQNVEYLFTNDVNRFYRLFNKMSEDLQNITKKFIPLS